MNLATDQVAPVILGFVALLNADAGLQSIFGGSVVVRERGSVQAIAPGKGIYWSIIDQSPGEHMWDALVQWDVRGDSYDVRTQISDRLAAVMHRRNPFTVNGVFLWSHLASKEDGPDDDSTVNIYRYRPAKATGA